MANPAPLLRIAGCSSVGDLNEAPRQWLSADNARVGPVRPVRHIVQRSALARGLAREYDAQKSREETHKARLARCRQIKERQAHGSNNSAQNPNSTHEAGDGSGDDDEDSDKQDDDRDTMDGNVILRIRDRQARRKVGSQKQKGNRPSGVVVLEKQSTRLAEKSRLRSSPSVPLTNQERGSSHAHSSRVDDRDRQFVIALEPSPLSLAKPLRLQSTTSTSKPKDEKSGVEDRLTKQWPVDLSSELALCELSVTKNIIVREQVVGQLRDSITLVDKLARELADVAAAKKTADAVATMSANRSFRARRTSSSITLLRPESGGSSPATTTAELEENREMLSARQDQLKETVRACLVQVKSYLTELRSSTASITEGIDRWRTLRGRRRKFSNFEPLIRFSWRNGKIPNYILRMNADVRELFHSTALAFVLGSDAAYNPLLLPRAMMDRLELLESETGLPSNTFLTDKVDTKATTTSKDAGKSMFDQGLYDALVSAFGKTDSFEEQSRQTTYESSARWEACLILIARELELEAHDVQRREEDAERLRSAYNPFQSIKVAGGVDEQLTTLLTAQAPHVSKLTEQLRHRQEDIHNRAHMISTSDGSESDRTDAVRGNGPRLHVNARRLRDEFHRRLDASVAEALCEEYEVASDSPGAKKNKLQGKVLLRKSVGRRREDLHASIIQRQFLAYRARNHLLGQLTEFVLRVRRGATDIQRVFRGHREQVQFRYTLECWRELRRRQEAARRLALAYRRFKRRQRYDQSTVTVEEIAQVQLQSIQRAHETDGERFRRVGEERRRQRMAVLALQQQQKLAHEAARVDAAVRIQSLIRSRLAQGEAQVRREEKKAHLTAVGIMTIQSSIRKFLRRQEDRRHRFRRDLERVNRSAVRIQSIYRGYSSRASMLLELDDDEGDEQQSSALYAAVPMPASDESEDDEDLDDSTLEDELESIDKLPVIAAMRPPSRSRDNPRGVAPHAVESVVLPPLPRRSPSMVVSRPSLSTPTARPMFSRQQSTGPTSMTRIELKLKESVIGDDLQESVLPTAAARRNSVAVMRG